MLKRQVGSVGKYPVDYNLKSFYLNYKKTTTNPIDNKTYNAFFKDLTGELMDAMIETSNEIKIPNIGYFVISGKKPKLIDENGNLNKKVLKPDWKKTWDFWYTTYPNKTQSEIIDTPNKKLLYYENKHTLGIRYIFKWINFTSVIKGKQGYRFIPVTKYKKELNNYIRNNPNMCYYDR